MLLRLPKLAAPFLAFSIATGALAQTEPYGIFDISGSVTFVEPSHQGQFAGLNLGDSLWGTPLLDLSSAPAQGAGDSLLYATTNTPAVFVGDTFIPREIVTSLPPFVITDGTALAPDRIDYEYPVEFWGGPGIGSIQGTARVSFTDTGGDAWSSPLIAGLPFPLLPDLAQDQSATLEVVAATGELVLEAALSTLYLDLSNESRCFSNLNSTFQTGRLTGVGSRVFADNSFSIFADRLPLDSFGLFITSATEGIVQNPGGQNGVLCINGDIGRYLGQVQSSGSTGTMTLNVDLTSLPTAAGTVSISAGETRYFQLWHRDVTDFGQATNNFTLSLGVLFQ